MIETVLHHRAGVLIDAAVHDVGLEPRLDLGDRFVTVAERRGHQVDVRILLVEVGHVGRCVPVAVGEEPHRP